MKIATGAEKYLPFFYFQREKGGAGSALISYNYRKCNICGEKIPFNQFLSAAKGAGSVLISYIRE